MPLTTLNRVKRCKLYATVTAGAIAVSLMFSAGAAANDESPPAPPSLDDLLGLDEDERERSADEAARRQHQEELDRRLAGERMAESFEQALQKMSVSASMLDEQFDAGLGTQRVQEEILRALEDMIKNARASSASSSSSSSSQSPVPRPQSPGQQQGQEQQQSDQAQGGENDGGEMELPAGQDAQTRLSMEETRAEWGNLPDRVRDMLLQGRQERFSSLYDRLTREYYRRLAED